VFAKESSVFRGFNCSINNSTMASTPKRQSSPSSRAMLALMSPPEGWSGEECLGSPAGESLAPRFLPKLTMILSDASFQPSQNAFLSLLENSMRESSKG